MVGTAVTLPESDLSPRNDDFRLPEVLRQRRDEEGGYSGLERAILEANRDVARASGRCKIDRRKLAAIVEGATNVPLTFDELRLLDRYLERHGESLAVTPLMKKPDLFRMLSERGHVSFLLGFREATAGDFAHLAHWDVLAMGEVQAGISRSGRSPLLHIVEVPVAPTQKEARASVEGGEWPEELKRRKRSIVVPGSSRAVPAAELLLCLMFGCKPYEDAEPEVKEKLPFHFLWSDHLSFVFYSAFRKQPSDIRGTHPEVAREVEDGKVSALLTGNGEVFVDDLHEKKHGTTYGICAVQRRRHGQIWLALAGVTGPATLVAARLAKDLAPGLADEPHGVDSAIWWGAVSGQVPEDPELPLSRHRQFTDERFVSGPHRWVPPS